MRPHRVAASADHFELVVDSALGEEKISVTLPNEYRHIYEGLKSGKTLRQTTSELLAQKRFVGFRATVKTLDLLCLGHIIENHQEYEVFLDQLRSPYRWQQSWVKTDLFRVPLTPPLTTRWAHWHLGVLMGVFLISWLVYWALPKIFVILLLPQKMAGPPLMSLALFYFCSSLLLTLKNVVRQGLTLMIHGSIAPIQLRMNILGCYLDECPLRIAYTEANAFANAVIIIVSGLVLVFGSALFQSLMPTLFAKVPLGYLLGILLLVEGSPFVHSNLTEILSQLYNWPQTRSKVRSRKPSNSFWHLHRDTLIYAIHLGVTLMWVCFLALILTFGFSILWNFLAQTDQLFGSISAGSILLTLFFFGVFLFLLGDMTLGLNYSGPNQSFRRYWYRWRRRYLAAPKQEKSPFEILSEFPLFSEIKPEVRKLIAQRARIMNIPSHHHLCHTGQRSRDLFLILAGSVGVYRRDGLGKLSTALELRSGSVVGEVSFFSGVPRTADVVSLEPTVLLKIEHSLETENLVLAQDRFEFVKDRIWLMQTLASSALFFRIPFEALQLIVQLGKVCNLPAGKRIATQGQEGNSCYIIIQGEVAVEVSGSSRPPLKRGDIMGEISLLFGSARTATLTALTETKVLEISREEFWHLAANHLSLGLFVERVALQRLKRDIEQADLG